MKNVSLVFLILATCLSVAAQQAAPLEEKRVALSERAVALDGTGAAALEASLRTAALNGAVDSPVTNIRLVVNNASGISYAFVTGLVTFYDGGGVRCGEGLFKAGALAVGEAFETDAPGIRIRCAPATWRIVATNLLPRVAPSPIQPTSAVRQDVNLMISVDGDEHPIQLDRSMVINVGTTQRTIVVRQAPNN